MENQSPATSKKPLTIVFPPVGGNGITPAKGTIVIDHEGNEISGVSGIELSAKANGLWKAKFTLNAAFSGALHVENSLGVPAIGEYWDGQGGYYAGIMRDGNRQWHLILASHVVGVTTQEDQSKKMQPPFEPSIKSEWGNSNKSIEGEFSRRDGMHNTALILASDPENNIASHFTSLLLNGHKDFYWPSECENNLLFANLPEHLSKEWHWSSTQYSAGYAWTQHFEDGGQVITYKNYKFRARAVRRLPIE